MPIRRTLWNARLARGRALEFLARLKSLEHSSREEVEAARADSLTRLLLHAHANVPYYRDLLEGSDVVRGGRVRLENFSTLPLLDKPTIRTRFHDLLSADRQTRGTYDNTSGGSTGEPVRFIQDSDTNDWKVAGKLLFDEWAGYRQGEPFAMLWGATHEMRDLPLRAKLGAYLRNELRLNAFLMSSSVMDEYIARLNRFKPTLILAYAQSIYELAEHAERTGQAIAPPRSIMTSATTLEPSMRTTIERVFQAPVFDRYGSREVGDVACENGDGLGMVTLPLTHYVEVVDEKGRPVPEGSTGELVVTLLVNYSMPLIRFRIGDAGTLGPALGASPWTRLTQVVGRVTDIFYTATGERIYGGLFTRHFYGKEWVAQFQIVQQAYDHLVVRVVPAGVVDSRTLKTETAELVAAFQGFMGSDCRVDVEIVDSIDVGPTGKRRYTISHVGPPT